MTAAERELAVDATIIAAGETLAGEDIRGGPNRYLNRLVLISSEKTVDEVTVRLKQIERRLGRRSERDAAGHCDIDIDLLARLETGQLHWLSIKPLTIPAVRQLVVAWLGEQVLAEAEATGATPDPSVGAR